MRLHHCFVLWASVALTTVTGCSNSAKTQGETGGGWLRDTANLEEVVPGLNHDFYVVVKSFDADDSFVGFEVQRRRANGRQLWSRLIGAENDFILAIAPIPSGLAIATSATGDDDDSERNQVLSLSLRDGSTVWSKELEHEPSPSAIVADGDALVVSTCDDESGALLRLGRKGIVIAKREMPPENCPDELFRRDDGTVSGVFSGFLSRSPTKVVEFDGALMYRRSTVVPSRADLVGRLANRWAFTEPDRGHKVSSITFVDDSTGRQSAPIRVPLANVELVLDVNGRVLAAGDVDKHDGVVGRIVDVESGSVVANEWFSCFTRFVVDGSVVDRCSRGELNLVRVRPIDRLFRSEQEASDTTWVNEAGSFESMTAAGDGGLYVLDALGGSRQEVLRVDRNGSVRWRRPAGIWPHTLPFGPLENTFISANSKGVAVVASDGPESSTGITMAESVSTAVRWYDSEGELQWTKRVGTGFIGRGVVQADDDGVTVAHCARKGMVIRFDLTGRERFRRTFPHACPFSVSANERTVVIALATMTKSKTTPDGRLDNQLLEFSPEGRVISRALDRGAALAVRHTPSGWNVAISLAEESDFPTGTAFVTVAPDGVRRRVVREMQGIVIASPTSSGFVGVGERENGQSVAYVFDEATGKVDFANTECPNVIAISRFRYAALCNGSIRLSNAAAVRLPG